MTKVARRKSTTPTTPEPEAVAVHPEIVASSGNVNDPFLGKRHGRVVVGLDPSLTGTALCFYDVDTGEHQAYRLKPKTKGVQRLLEIQNFVHAKLHVLGLVSDEIGCIVMEAPGFASQKAFVMGEGTGAIKLAVIQALGRQRKIAYPGLIAPNSLKKFVLGKGVGEKSDMKIQVFKRWNAEFSDDNECDAFALAQVAACIVRPELVEFDYQREVLAKVQLHAEWPD